MVQGPSLRGHVQEIGVGEGYVQRGGYTRGGGRTRGQGVGWVCIPIPPTWELGRTITRIVGKQAVHMLLECFLLNCLFSKRNS